MPKINWSRVFLGGLLAGVIINAGEIAFHWVILGGDWWFFKAFNRPLRALAAAVGPYIGLRFLGGIAAIWLYAAIRPRFGPGPRAAVWTGFAYWVIAQVLPTLSFAPLLASHPWLQGPLHSLSMWVIASLVGLAEIILATLGGAWLYREKE